MPIPPNRRIRYTLTVVGALGLIAAGSASIVAGTASGDGEVRLAAAAPDADRTNADAAPSATVDALPDTSPTATPAVSKSAGPSASASVVPPRSTLTTVRPSTQPTSSIKRRPRASTPAPTATTSTPSNGGTASSSVTAEVIRLVNIERQKAGCSGLSGESRLEAAAQKHSELQAAQNSMSHQLPGEASMGDRVTAEGYRWRGVAENVAAGYTSPASVMNGWMNSPGHKANILNCAYTEIGVGLAKSSSGTQYWTQNFATPA